MIKLNIDVIVKRDSEFWYCQGVQIDYVSQGNTEREAIGRFKHGLNETLKLNQNKFGTVEKVFKWAPMNEWNEAKKKLSLQFMIPE